LLLLKKKEILTGNNNFIF